MSPKTPDTERRLRMGREATASREATLEQLSDAILAMQSLDDLGSPEANQAAWKEMCALQERYEALKRAKP